MAVLMRAIGLAAWLAMAASSAHAAENIVLYEQKIKAGLLYNFLKYTAWPQSETAMQLCILGDDSFDRDLKPMEQRTVNQRSIAIRHINGSEQAGACHLLFVTGQGKAQWHQWRQALTGKAILTVGDFPGFTASGGILEFSRKDSRISVDLNMSALGAASLKVEDRLLRLVNRVEPAATGTP